MEKIMSKEMFQEKKAKEQAIFMFSAAWCPDCRFIEPALPEIEKSFPQYQFYYVDRDQFIEVCQEMDIFGIPSFVAFKNGKEIGRLVNKNRKTKEEIASFIESLD